MPSCLLCMYNPPLPHSTSMRSPPMMLLLKLLQILEIVILRLLCLPRTGLPFNLHLLLFICFHFARQVGLFRRLRRRRGREFMDVAFGVVGFGLGDLVSSELFEVHFLDQVG